MNYMDLFEEAVQRYSSRIAMVDSEGAHSVTYAELDRLSALVAGKLRSLGLGRGDFIPVCMGRRLEYFVAYLGVLKAGAVVVPIVPDYPEERISFICGNCDARLMITEDFMGDIERYEPVYDPADGKDGALLIYTSGSTGAPKGILHSVGDMARAAKRGMVYFAEMDTINLASVALFSFIVHNVEFNTPFLLGATIHILPDEVRTSAAKLEDYFNRFSINFSFISPQMMRFFHLDKVPSLTTVMMAGERVSNVYSERVRIYNGYGMSETSHAVWFPLDRAYANSPVGYPMPGIEVRVCDENGKLLPDGQEGETWICGEFDCVYYKDPARTAATMIPLGDRRTGIRTGDICYKDEKGRLVFVSRKDWMVKVNGQRVETLEIESLMMQMPEVRTAVVKAFEDADGQTYIAAYYDLFSPLAGETLRTRLREKLPEYMIPRFFVELAEMPKNPNGKLDRKSLTAPDAERYKSAYAPPENERQAALCRAFSEVLRCGEIGIDDDFFALGGDSIKVLELMEADALIESPAQVLSGRTPRGIAALWAGAARERIPHLEPLPEVTPLTDSQRGVYLECITSPGSVMYNVPSRLDLPAGTDPERFLSAVRTVIAARPVFRSTIELRNGMPSMILHDWEIPVEDKTVADLAAECADFVKPFDLEKGPLCRFELCRSGDGLAFLFDVHHLIFDGVSSERFIADVALAYDGGEIPPEELNLFDLAHAEAKAGDEAASRAKAFFDGLLCGVDPDSSPIPDAVTEDVPDTAGRFRIGTDRKFSKGEIERFVRSRGISENTLFLGAFAYALACFNGTRSSCFCTAYHGRKDPALANAVGMFVRTLPLAFRFEDDAAVADFLPAVQQQLSGAIDNADVSFADLAAEYGVSSDVVFIYQGEIAAGAALADGQIRVRTLETRDIQTKLDFMLFTGESGYELLAHYDRTLYTEGLIRALANLFLNTVAGMLRSEKLSAIALTDADDRELLDSFNRTECPYDTEKTVIDLFREQARRTPDSICAVAGETRLTYRETDEKTDRIAAYLLQRGFGPGKTAGVLIPRCAGMVTLSLAVLKAGGAYLPLDPTYPPERLNQMVEDSGASLLILAPEYRDTIGDDFTGTRLLTGELEDLPELPAVLPCPRPEDPFVMLYTSGSTGKPKGVVFRHSNVMVTAQWVRKYFDVNESSRVTSYASYGFDAHIFDIYPALISGAQLHVITDDIRLDFNALRTYFNDNGITHAVMTTQVGRQFALLGGLKTLRHLSVAGEKLTPVDPPAGFALYNLYGPTEGSVVTSGLRIDRKYRDVPIGRPVDNLKAYIVSPDGRLLPPGGVGELWIAGPHVTPGYHERPEKTAEAYGENPFPHPAGYDRVYRTGDIVRFLSDGDLQFIGRRDGQVKIRGFRVELTEVEEVVRRFEGIKDATVAAFDEPGGGKYLVAYVVSDEAVDTDALHAFIRERKPPYMVPAVTMQIPAIPLTQNSKVNRRALPVPERKAEQFLPPETEMQQRIFELCAEAMGHSSFGADTDLFDAGLTSIGALKLNVLLSDAFRTSLRMDDLKRCGTIRALEALLGSARETAAHDVQPDYPLTQTQQGIFVECSAHPGTILYNIPLLMKLCGDVDGSRLASAVHSAIDAHPYLKATLFADETGAIRARRQDDAESIVRYVVCDALPEGDALVQPFSLLESPLYRAAVYDTAEGTYLFLDIHHILSDGTSEAILLEDISRAYGGEALEKESYTGFEAALDEEEERRGERYQAAKAYYDSVFSGCESDSLPPACPEDSAGGDGTVTHVCAVPADEVLRFCESINATPNAFLNAAFGFTLSRFTTVRDAVFTTVYNGRNDSRLGRAVSMLVKTLPVLVRAENDRPVSELIRETREQLMNSMANDVYSFAEISAAYGIRADVMLVYQGDSFRFDTLCGVPAEAVEVLPSAAKAPITVSITLADGRFALSADYRREKYSEGFIRSLLEAFEQAMLGFTKETALSGVSLLSPAAEARIAEMNDTARDFERVPVPRLFEKHAAAHPDCLAVIDRNRRMTYGELNRAANRAAHALIERGVKPDTVVCLLMDRSIYISLTELAILKAGGAFLGMTPSYPDERIDFCLRDSDCPLVVTTPEAMAAHPDLFGDDKPYRSVTVSELLENTDETVPDVEIPMDSLAYCIYTSGSTGKPKGVMIEHHNLANCARQGDSGYSTYVGDRRPQTALAISSITFDASVFDSLLCLLNGMTVVIASDEEIHNPGMLSSLMLANHVETFVCTPSFLTNYITVPEFRTALREIRSIVVAAEAFPPALFTRIREIAPEAHILNGYGPSECTVTGSVKEIQSPEDITIGSPVPNCKLYVRDEWGNILPPCACGELIICGEPVGRGYRNLPERTKAAFFELNGLRAYRSGDTVRMNLAGEMEFFGRMDDQVKLRGFRVELDEVEKAFGSYPGIDQSKVIVRNNGSEDYLAGYFTAETQVDLSALRRHLKSRLAYYMVPDAMAQLEAMPLTPNGKIDKKALPEIRKERRSSGHRAARKSLEQELCELFRAELGLEEYYADDNYFELGGTSLSASKLTMQLMAKGYKVEYQNIFDYPTPEELAAFLQSQHDETAQKTAEEKSTDPSGVAALLKYNTLSHAAEVTRRPLGDVLLTGAVGFLGIHVLRELIEREEGNILCLVRKGRSESPEKRLKNMLVYYFSDTFDEALSSRIRFVDADITDNDLPEILRELHFDTVINCAASVKHYAADDTIERVNVHGVENLIRCAMEKGARMIQISTTSVPGVHTDETYQRQLKMHENELFMVRDMNNKYLLSKYNAELKILEGIRSGLRGKIIRVGNLMGRHSDGEFQINFNTNSFMNALRGFAALGKCPISHATDPMSFSPVDLTAKVVVLLAGTNDQFTAFHADNRFRFDEMQLIEAANGCGIPITPVPDEEYYADYYRALGDENVNEKMRGLMTNDRPDLHPVETDNLFTANVLYRLGFSWPLVDQTYLRKALLSLKTLDYFEVDEQE